MRRLGAPAKVWFVDGAACYSGSGDFLLDGTVLNDVLEVSRDLRIVLDREAWFRKLWSEAYPTVAEKVCSRYKVRFRKEWYWRDSRMDAVFLGVNEVSSPKGGVGIPTLPGGSSSDELEAVD
jgi:hypothetical protein